MLSPDLAIFDRSLDRADRYNPRLPTFIVTRRIHECDLGSADLSGRRDLQGFDQNRPGSGESIGAVDRVEEQLRVMS